MMTEYSINPDKNYQFQIQKRIRINGLENERTQEKNEIQTMNMINIKCIIMSLLFFEK